MPEHPTGRPPDAAPRRVRLPLPGAVDAELKDRALAASDEGITIADARLPDMPLVYANAGFERLTGYRVSEALGRNCRFLQGPDTEAAAVDRIRAALAAERGCTVELLNYRKDGTPFWNRLAITPVRDEAGRVTHYIGIQSDLSEQKRIEAELRAAKASLEAIDRRRSAELEAAAAVQRSLLPLELPRVEGVELRWHFRPCDELAGDILDVVELDGERIGLYLLDVAGHGVPAALLSVTLSQLLPPVPGASFLFARDPAAPGSHRIATPSELMGRLARRFPAGGQTKQHFTIFYGVLDRRRRRLTYAAAGHPPALYLAPGDAARELTATGPPIGLLAGAAYGERSLDLAPGGRLFVYSDGLVEATSPAGEELGRRRLGELLRAAARETLEECLVGAVREVDRWRGGAPLEDDLSILALEVRREVEG